MSKPKSCDSFEKLKEKLSYITNSKDLETIENAYQFALDKHFGQKRLTGENYITHPLSVAYILTSINADTETICAALLHDTIISGQTNLAEIKENFGEEITSLVEGFNKINKLNFYGDSQTAINNQRKILVGLSEDVRVIIIKLADRLHNMKTLFVLDEKKQKEKAKETLDILTPIAHRLGMNNIKTELEELSLRYLKTDEYYDIVEKLNTTKTQRDQNVAKMIESVSNLLTKHGINFEIKGRSKSIYSIYKKLEKGKRFSDIYDLLALRVLVETEQECYQALGIIHSKFKPKPNRFKDYIAMPKTNMYQSLHTTVFGEGGQLYEIQIRTYKMDEIAENGIASHWSYKEKGSNKISLQTDMEQKLQFFKSIIELKNTEENPEEFVKSVKEDILKDTIYVFTPKGDVIELPAGATPIDFAYKVHTKVGEGAVGAIVNGQIVPLDHKLQNQDIVKINTSATSTPKRQWLTIVKTAQAKNKIKSYFNKINKNENIKLGEEILYKYLRKQKISFSDFEKKLDKIISHLKVGSLNEIYDQLATEKTTPDTLIQLALKEDNKQKTTNEIVQKMTNKSRVIIKPNMISVSGLDDIKVNLASCCKPVYEDRIVGYITKGHGINIHRMVCPNISSAEERLIEVSWNQTKEKYATTILIKAETDTNLLVNIIAKANNDEVGIQSINNHKQDIYQSIEMTVLVLSKTHLIKFINDLKNIPEILEVERLIK